MSRENRVADCDREDGPEALPERLDAVLVVVYLIFNEGWGGGRVDLASEAIRLGRALVELMPDESEAIGLLALMLMNDSRQNARFRDDGELVLFDDQDHTGVPPEWHDHISTGYPTFYQQPLERYFAAQPGALCEREREHCASGIPDA